MNIFKYLQRQFGRLKIDWAIQHTFLAGQIPSIDNRHIIKTVSTNYEELEVIFFKRVQLKADDVIIDVGCGKGRVFNYLLYKGLRNTMIGYEINREVAYKTRQRLARFKNVSIRSENIFDDFPREGNVFYLYHPFKEEMMKDFVGRMLAITERNPVIVYNNPVYVDFFDPGNFVCEIFDETITEYDYAFKFAVIRVKGSNF